MDSTYQVIKLRPDGTEATRYRAVPESENLPDTWLAVRAEWVFNRVESHGLVFEPGDSLVEYFSTVEWFNGFRVEAPNGEVRGWYSNVTFPTTLTYEPNRSITWHDLYLDVIALPDGSVILCDEDELEESGLANSDPDLYSRIVDVAGHVTALADTGSFPFHRTS